MTNLDDTQPNRPRELDERLQNADGYNDGVPAPPRILLWGIIVLFVLAITGALAGVYAFREVLTPGQQVRVINTFPFMEALLPPRPGPSDTLPTAGPVDEDAAQNLLTSPINQSTPEATAEATPESTPEATPEVTPEATEETSLDVAAAPTATPTAVPSTPEPTTPPTEAASQPVPVVDTSTSNAWDPSAYNGGFVHQQQTWNNCGPATITMALSYYGWRRDQAYAASYLKPEREDKNVSPSELARFVNEQSDIDALTRMGGDLDLLRTLVDNEFPVIIERSHMFEGYDWIGHYQTIVGYDDALRTFYIYDSFLGVGGGEGHTETYDEVDRAWQDFNRTFIVVYEPSRESHLMNLLGDLSNPVSAAQRAFDVAQAEANANPQDAFAWFNMGTSLTELGRYEEASRAYDRATQIGLPWRMLWYQFGPFEAYFEVGRYEDVLTYVNNNLSNGGEYVEETYYWQGRVYAAQGRTQDAAVAFRNALRHNRLYTAAQEALDELNS